MKINDEEITDSFAGHPISLAVSPRIAALLRAHQDREKDRFLSVLNHLSLGAQCALILIILIGLICIFTILVHYGVYIERDRPRWWPMPEAALFFVLIVAVFVTSVCMYFIFKLRNLMQESLTESFDERMAAIEAARHGKFPADEQLP